MKRDLLQILLLCICAIWASEPYENFEKRYLDIIKSGSAICDHFVFSSLRSVAIPAHEENSIYFKNIYLTEWTDFLTAVINQTLTGDLPGNGEEFYIMCASNPFPTSGKWDPSAVKMPENQTPKNLSRALDILKNFGKTADDVPGMAEACRRLIPSRLNLVNNYRKIVDAINLPYDPFGSLWSLKHMALFLGDGTITGEVDLEGHKLEGGVASNILPIMIEAIKSFDFSKFPEPPVSKEELDEVVLHLEGAYRHFVVFSELQNVLDSDVFDAYESIMIEFLREMRVGEEVLLPLANNEHEMAMEIKKEAQYMYEMTFFNSGAGLQYHQFIGFGHKKKFIPVRRFKQLNTAVLKDRAIFRRLGEMIGAGGLGFELEKTRKVFDEKHLHEIILASIEDFEVIFEDEVAVRAISDQRSGTCSVRSLLSYIGTKLKNYRTFKLMLYQILIKAAVEKKWSSEDSATARKIIKYAFENHARSLLKFSDEDQTLNIEWFGDSKFFDHYHFYSLPIWEKKPESFKLGLGTFKPTTKYHDDIIARSREIEGYYKDFMDQRSTAFERDTAECEAHMQKLLSPKSNVSISGFLSSILAIKEECWKLQKYDMIAFLTFQILHNLPVPSFKDRSFWLEAIKGMNENDLEMVPNIIFKLVKHLLALQLESKAICPEVYVSITKLAMIQHMILCNSYPEASSLVFSADNLKFFKTLFNPHLFLDITNLNQLEELESLGKDGGEVVTSMKSLLNSTALSSILSKMAGKAKVDNKSIRNKRSSTEIPSLFYYWRATAEAMFKVADMNGCPTFLDSFNPTESNFDEERCFEASKCDSVPSLPSDPYNSFQAISQGNYARGILYAPNISGSNAKDDYSTLESALRNYGFSTDELSIYHNVLYGGFNQIGTFIRALYEYEETLDWASVLYLGIGSINQASRDPIALNRLVSELNSKMSLDYSQLEKISTQLSKTSSGTDPAVLRVIRKYFASLILLGSAADLIPGDSTVSRILQKHQENALMLVKIPSVHKGYLVYMTFAYVASFRCETMAASAAPNVLAAYSRLTAVTDLLPSNFERKIYMNNLRMTAVYIAFHLYVIEDISGIKHYIHSRGMDDAFEKGNCRLEFPLVQGKSGNQYNLVTGEVFNAQGRGINSLSFSFAEDLPKKAGLEIQQRSVLNILRSIAYNYATASYVVLTTFKMKPTEELLELQFLQMAGKTFCRKIFKDGALSYYLPDPSLLADSPIPALKINAKDCTIWAYPATDYILFESMDEKYISHNGLMSFPSYGLANLGLIEMEKQSLVNPLSGEVLLFKASDTLYLLYRRFRDPSSDMLWFRYCEEKWNLLSDETFYISSDQVFEDSGFIQSYLLLQDNSGHERVILPVEFYYTEKKSKTPKMISKLKMLSEGRQTKFSAKHLTKRLGTEMISIDGNKVSSSSRYHDLLLSYRFLVSREYQRSFVYLNRLHHMEPLSENELRILAWILTSNDSNRDGSPESCAIRAYAAFKVFGNMSLYKYKMDDESTEKPNSDPFLEPYENDVWGVYWSSGKARQQVKRTMEIYTKLYSNIPFSLRFDYHSNRGLMSKEEMDDWCRTLKSSEINSFKNKLFRSTETERSMSLVSKLTYSNVEATECASVFSDLLKDYKEMSVKQGYFKDLNLPNVSWIEADDWKSSMKKMMCYLVGADMIQEPILIEYKRFLRSFKDTKESQFAAIGLEIIKRKGNLEELKRELNACTFSPDGGHACAMTMSKFLGEIYGSMKTANKIPQKLYIPAKRQETKVVKLSPSGSLTTPKFTLPTELSLDDLKDSGLKQGDLDQDDAIQELEVKVDSLMLEIRSIHESHGSSSSDFKVKLERIAHGTPLLLESELAHLYVHADKKHYFSAFPSVPEALYQSIHDTIHELILAKTYRNDMIRLNAAFIGNDQVAYKTEIESRRWNWDSRSKLNERAQRIVLAYEFFIDSRLSIDQLHDIEHFCKKQNSKYTSRIVQRMMAAGKTFIIGTLLATIKADKESLSVLVVPRALYTQEASNIIQRTKSAFGTEGFSFAVDRQTPVDNLEWLLHSLRNAINQGRYVIIAPESLLVLHNKFAEAMLTKDTENFIILKGIIELLRSKGAGTLDEIDMTFDPIQQLNFPLSEYPGSSILSASMSTEHLLVKQAFVMAEISVSMLKLYSQFVEQCKAGKGPFCHDFSNNVLIKPEDYESMKSVIINELIQKMLTRKFDLPLCEDGDLYIFNFEYLPDPSSSLERYLSIDEKSADAGKAFETIKSAVSGDTYKLLATARLAINEWILQAWNQNVNESYGITEMKHDDGKIRNYAIPFIGAKTPKKNSEFSFKWLCYIRTMRTYLTNGFTRCAAQQAIKWIYDLALSEVKINGHLKVGHYERVMEAAFGMKMVDIDMDDPSMLVRIIERLEAHHSSSAKSLDYLIFMMSWIAEDLIPNIRFYPYQISANPLDISIMLSSIQGYSGTISTVKIFPEEFHNKNDDTRWLLDANVDRQIKERILHHSQFKAIIVPDSATSSEFFMRMDSFIMEQEALGRPFVALIDVGAYFKDESNESVAEALLNIRVADQTRFLKTHALYFDPNENKLAVKVQGHAPKIFESVSRKTIEEFAPVESKRTTYYDQLHTTGVDIFQHEQGFAILIIGLKTTLRDFNQAIMRLRKLLTASQRAVIVVPKCVQAEILKFKEGDEKIFPIDVLRYCAMNLAVKSRQQNLSALHNLIGTKCKEFALSRILKTNSEKCICPDTWLKKTESPVEELVAPMLEMQLSDAAEKIKMKALDDISECLQEADLETKGTESESSRFTKQLDKIIANAIKDFDDYPATVSLSSHSSDTTVETKVETTKLLETNNQQEVEAAQKFDYKIIFERLDLELPDIPLLRGQDIHYKNSGIVLLKDYIEEYPGFDLIKGMFDEKIGFTKCFIDTLFGESRKIAQYILHLKKEDDEMFIVMSGHVAKTADWVIKNQDGIIYGYVATLIDNTGYVVAPLRSTFDLEANRRILAETLIFSGSFKLLATPEWIHHVSKWISEDRTRRSVFFKNIVLSQKELKRFEQLPLAKDFQVSPSLNQKILVSPELTVLYYACGQPGLSQRYYQQYSQSGEFRPLDLLRFVDMDLNGSAISSDYMYADAKKGLLQDLEEKIKIGEFDEESERIMDLTARIYTRKPEVKAWQSNLEFVFARLAFILESHQGSPLPSKFLEVFGDRSANTRPKTKLWDFQRVNSSFQKRKIWQKYPDLLIEMVPMLQWANNWRQETAAFQFALLPTQDGGLVFHPEKLHEFYVQIVVELIKMGSMDGLGVSEHIKPVVWPAIKDSLSKNDLALFYKAMLFDDRSYWNRNSAFFEEEAELKIFDTPLTKVPGYDAVEFYNVLLTEALTWEDLRAICTVFNRHDRIKISESTKTKINDQLSKKEVQELKETLATIIS